MAGEQEQFEATWQAMQSEIAALSANSRQIVAEQGGHDIHLQEPQLVVEAIQAVIQFVSRRPPTDQK